MFKKILFVFLVLFFLMFGGVIFYFSFIQEEKIPILTYHNIVDSNPNLESCDISFSYFEKQMKYLNDHNYRTITPDEFYNWKKGHLKLPRKTVFITFDDGWISTYEKALPILEKYNLKASIFVAYGYVIATKDSSPSYMNRDMYYDIKDNHKNISLLSHSFSLHVLGSTSITDYEHYNEDIKHIREHDNDVKYYAYPFGYYNENFKKALKNNDYKMAFTFGPYDLVSKNSDDFEIPRLNMREDYPFWKFKSKILLHI